MSFKNVTPPAGGKISLQHGKLNVPDNPVLPFIRGDGTGPDIWRASQRVFDAAVRKPIGGKRKVAWFEVFAGETAKKRFDTWLPDDTVEAFKEFLCRHQGPADHPRRRRHPFAECRAAPDAGPVRLPAPGPVFPGRAFPGEASGEGGHGDLPRKHRRHLRRNRIRRRARRRRRRSSILSPRSSPRTSKRSASARKPGRRSSGSPWVWQDFPAEVKVGLGLKPVSYSGSERLIHSAISYAIKPTARA